MEVSVSVDGRRFFVAIFAKCLASSFGQGRLQTKKERLQTKKTSDTSLGHTAGILISKDSRSFVC